MLSLLTFTTLVQRFAASVQSAAAAALDFTVGSVLLALAEATASVALWMQWLILLVAQTTRAATSSGAALDTWMADFSFTRLPAVAATGTVAFSRYTAASSAFVPVGAQVKSADGTLIFNVIADPTQACWNTGMNGYLIPPGTTSGNVTVQAAVAGSSGNVLANTVTLLASGISNIDYVNNAGSFTGGIDAESDAAFRTRFAAYIASLRRGTLAAVQYAATAVQQGLTCVIAENVNSSNTYTPGTFVVTVDDGSGSPPTSLLTSVGTAVNLYRPVGSTFYVQAPTVVTVTVGLTITVVSPGVKATLQPLVQAAITSYLNALPMGTATVPYSKLSAIAYGVDPTISNVSSLLVNGGTADIAIATGSVPKAGTITVS